MKMDGPAQTNKNNFRRCQYVYTSNSPYHGLVNKLGRVKVVELYRDYISKQNELLSKLHLIKDKVLARWCAPELCHGDVLKELTEQS